MGKSAQQKGRHAELELVRILTEKGYDSVKAGRVMSFGEVPDIIGLKNIHVEVKRVEKLDLYKALRQSQNDSERFSDGLPVVIHRTNRKPWVVSMSLSDWLELYDKSSNEAD